MKLTKLCLVVGLVLVLGLTGCSAKSTTGNQTFTVSQLAQYNGQNGNKAYVAIDGKVYDVTNNQAWRNGTHHGLQAGVDLSAFISQSPHGKGILSSLTVVGTLK
ncbi:MAG: cytochrome b5 domain-containing protein [Erysipelotrichaceae bacterium]